MINQLNILHTQEVSKRKAVFLRMPMLMSAKKFPYTIHLFNQQTLFSTYYVPGTVVDPGIRR